MLADAPLSRPLGDTSPAPVRVQARWTAPDDTPRTGRLPVFSGTPRGARVSLWVDREGNLVDRPQRRGETLTIAATRAGFAVFALAAALLSLLWLLHCGMERRRLAEWDLAWLRTEPMWSDRRRDGPT